MKLNIPYSKAFLNQLQQFELGVANTKDFRESVPFLVIAQTTRPLAFVKATNEGFCQPIAFEH